jgi:hypothetical protein
LLDGSEAVLYEGKWLRYVVLCEPAKRAEGGEELLSQRQYVAEQERKVWKPASGSSLAEELEGERVCDTIEAFGYVTFQTGN